MSELEALAVANIQVPGRSWLVEGQSMRNSWHPAMVARGIVTANGETVPICPSFQFEQGGSSIYGRSGIATTSLVGETEIVS